MQMLLSGSGDDEHKEQAERCIEQVELSAAIVLRGAAGWQLDRAEAGEGHVYTTFRRAWGSGAAPASLPCVHPPR